ncbi:MAG: SH3 domain-containing protein [Caldilineales bacterium]|nr:SH3 domain-containing protein [Caldilineales bacterium]MCW5857819.1 SH3 domain-containing protein [Caldilineales bacterium]
MTNDPTRPSMPQDDPAAADEMARWQAQYDAGATPSATSDEGMYDPPYALLTDREVESPGGGERPWTNANLLRLIIVAVLLVIVLFLVLRACTSRPTPAPGAQTTPLATATPAGGIPQPTYTPTLAAVPITATVSLSPTLSVATPLPGPTGGQFAINQQVQVAGTEGEGVRFRTGPGLSYVTTSILQDGDTLIVVGGPETVDGFTWWRLQTAGGAIGWAAEDNLQPASR